VCLLAQTSHLFPFIKIPGFLFFCHAGQGKRLKQLEARGFLGIPSVLFCLCEKNINENPL